MRITTGMIANQYGRNLNTALGQLNFYQGRATNFRKFSSASQDPVGAAKAFSLRRSFSHTEDHLSNIDDAENLFQTAHSAKLGINSIIEEIASNDILQGINGTYSQEDRTIVATKIRRLQDSILTNANAKYGDKFMFNGGNYTTPPFTIGDDGSLLYRGINVNTGEHIGTMATANKVTADGATIDFGLENATLLDGYSFQFDDTVGSTTTVDAASKTIKISTDGVTLPMTAAAIKTAIDSLAQPVPTPTPPDDTKLPANVDVSKITVTGDSATGKSVAIIIDKTKPATNKSAAAYMSGSNIDFGRKNGDLLNGYTLNVLQDTATPPATTAPSIDNNKKVINISLPQGATRQDLQNALQALPTTATPPAQALPTGVDPKAITLTDQPLSTTINFGTSEICGGEKSIAPGTKFDMDLLASETHYVDMGLGQSFSINDKLDNQSVFNIAMTGLSMLGYGVDENGLPNNLYTQLTNIANELEKSDDDFDLDKITTQMNMLNTQKDNLLYNITDTDSKATFIKFTKERLTESQINLQEKMLSVEQVEPAQAIMDFKMQEYAYMAALQIGTKIISPTLLDFLR